MIIYVYKANGILAAPLKNRTGAHLLETYQHLYEELETAGFKPKLHILDNEASSNFKQLLKKEKNRLSAGAAPHTSTKRR